MLRRHLLALVPLTPMALLTSSTVPQGWSPAAWAKALDLLMTGRVQFLEQTFHPPQEALCRTLDGALSGRWPAADVEHLRERRHGSQTLTMAQSLVVEAQKLGLEFSPDFHQRVERLRGLVERLAPS